MTRACAALVFTLASAAAAEVVTLPELALTASPDGQAQFDASAGLRFAAGAQSDASVRATWRVTTTSGLATLFAASSGDLSATRPWEAGLTASWILLAMPPALDAKSKAWADAVAACRPSCGNPREDDEKTFCRALEALEKRAEGSTPRLTALGKDEMCRAGASIIDRWQNERPDLRRHPLLVVNAGFRAGQQSLHHLDGDQEHLQVAPDKSFAHAATGISAIGLVGTGRRTLTLEGFAAFKRGFQEGSPAHFCARVGGVDTPGGNVPAEVCSDLPVGAPVGTKAFSGAAFVGLLDQVDDWWRVSAGVQADLPGSAGTTRIEFSIPAMFSLASTSLDYKGALRIGPSVVWNTAPGSKTEVSFGITLALLGQRLLFSQEFDRL